MRHFDVLKYTPIRKLLKQLKMKGKKKVHDQINNQIRNECVL